MYDIERCLDALNYVESTMYSLKEGEFDIDEYSSKEIKALNGIIELAKYIADNYDKF